MFWYALYLTPLVWALLGLICIIKLSFSWLLVVAVALALNIANAIGYIRCQRDAAAKRRAAAGGEGLFSGGVSSTLGRFITDSILSRART